MTLGRFIGENVTFEGFHEVQPGATVGCYPTGRDWETTIGDGAVIRSNAVIYKGNRIGAGFRTGHGTLVRELNVIGNNVSIGTNTVIEHQSVIEDDVRIHSQCFIPEYITIRSGAWLGPRVTILNAMHPPCPEFERCGKGIPAEGVENPRVHPVEIGLGAKIGGSATIGPWVRVGAGALVGAGSMVTKDVPEKMVVAGNPARVIGSVSDLRCQAGYFERAYIWEEEEQDE